MTPEQKASQAVRLRATAWGCRVFRNNSGVLPDKNGRPVRFGLGNESKRLNECLKSGDFIGITPILITPEMVGRVVGVFTNLEVKSAGFKERDNYPEGCREFAQNKFNELIISLGGCAGFATGDDDVDKLINNLFARLKRE